MSAFENYIKKQILMVEYMINLNVNVSVSLHSPSPELGTSVEHGVAPR